MAEVLPPLSQPSTTITMLHSRSASDAFPPAQQQQYTASSTRSASHAGPRGMANGQNNAYRTSSPPVQPYAFQSTPQTRLDSRPGPPVTGLRPAHSPSPSASTTSSTVSSQPSAKEDDPPTGSVAPINNPWQLPEISLTAFELPLKPSPERYRRPTPKRVDSNGPYDGPKGGGGGGGPTTHARAVSDIGLTGTRPAAAAVVDDVQSEPANGHRRRSLHQLETTTTTTTTTTPAAPVTPSPMLAQSDANRPSSTPHDSTAVDGDAPTIGLAAATTMTTTPPPPSQKSHDERPASPKTSSQPAKTSQPKPSAEPVKRAGAGPSPLSKQATQADGPSLAPSAAAAAPAAGPVKPKTYAAAAQSALATPSPAAAQLAAVSDRDLNKGMKSRLRRAFSFGGAQELRRAAGENNQAAAQQAQQARQQQRRAIDDELDAEQLEIARRQEAAGIGAGIYSGQGGFSGSMDNLSISSTASSASMMLRKMGRGAKKGARSVKGLFRPKSVIGVPAADAPLNQSSGAGTTSASASGPQAPTLAEVSMVTVEAERLNVNINAHPDERAGGTTGFPKLERNSLDAAALPSVGAGAGAAVAAGAHISKTDGTADQSTPHRRSIVGSDRERAEVLAAVMKGILKRSGTGSTNGSPTVQSMVESPATDALPAPGIPSDPSAKGRSASMTTAGTSSDYFAARAKGGPVARSVPGTPNGSARNISFSPRIQYHDVWSSSEYDRRSELATCNRLTPLLAQQIKEELNTFKMEMEVHELSKPHTHFF